MKPERAGRPPAKQTRACSAPPAPIADALTMMMAPYPLAVPILVAPAVVIAVIVAIVGISVAIASIVVAPVAVAPVVGLVVAVSIHHRLRGSHLGRRSQSGKTQYLDHWRPGHVHSPSSETERRRCRPVPGEGAQFVRSSPRTILSEHGPA